MKEQAEQNRDFDMVKPQDGNLLLRTAACYGFSEQRDKNLANIFSRICSSIMLKYSSCEKRMAFSKWRKYISNPYQLVLLIDSKIYLKDRKFYHAVFVLVLPIMCRMPLHTVNLLDNIMIGQVNSNVRCCNS